VSIDISKYADMWTINREHWWLVQGEKPGDGLLIAYIPQPGDFLMEDVELYEALVAKMQAEGVKVAPAAEYQTYVQEYLRQNMRIPPDFYVRPDE
jgi:hypothetical protein